MSLSAGKRLGHFEIIEAIGAGGMGQVYRARDTRLGREVAVKILPRELAASAGFRERFEREARTISSLNHPHICILHDIGRDEGLDYLVMEYLEGESLAQRLQKGPLSTGELLDIGGQVADALDRAHRAGLIHRDLKPGNIMVTPSGAKLLDFGVAKSTGAGGPANALTSSPTRTSPLTAAGAMVGTFQYMAPELFEGKEADVRSDIFAFGTVLYEMATGCRAFEGTTQAMVIASILKEAPRRLAEAAPSLPRGLGRLIDACLLKDPEKRRQSAHDLKLDLQALAEDTASGLGTTMAGAGGSDSGVGVPTAATSDPQVSGMPPDTRATRRSGPWFATSLLLAATLAALGAWVFLWQGPPPRVVRAAIPPPEDSFYVITGIGSGAAVLSPDGTRVAFTARQAGHDQLWVRRLDELEAVPLPGTAGARRLFWSPDSKFIAFFASGKLKKIAAGGGPALMLADAPDGRGGSWNKDGVIIFTPNYLGPLYRLSSGGGGEPLPVTVGDEATVFTHRYPYFLPDGDHFLFLDRGSTSGGGDSPTIRAGSLSDGVTAGKPVLEVASNVAYYDGHLLYMRDGTLLAQPFAAGALELGGEPSVIASDVVFDRTFSHGAFSISSNGILAYHAGQASINTQLSVFDREGNEIGRVGEPGQYDGPSLSPDGRLLAVGHINPESGKNDIWVHDLEKGTGSRLTFDDGDDLCPVWTPDGTKVTFGSARQRGFEPYLKPADGSTAGMPILESDDGVFPQGWTPDGDVFPLGWTPDGDTLLFSTANTTGQQTLAMVRGGDVASLWTVPGDSFTARLSTDGKWIAYVSDESGRSEIFIRSFPETAAKWQVSTGGGLEPRWRQDNSELFYRTPDGTLMAVGISSAGGRVAVGTIRPLFKSGSASICGSYDVSPDGQRFIVNAPLPNSKPEPLTLVLNWPATLED
ncbi:MAG: protein kinase [Acidobacteria bacterium]|nr:protein kinase [Acidobacteriota bacterium]